MRYTILTAIIAVLCIGARAEEAPSEPVEITLPVVDVTVAPGRAVVSRGGEVSLMKGPGKIRVANLPPAMDRDSLQVDLREAAGVQLESVKLELIATRKLEPERIQAAEKELAQTDRELKGLEDKHQLLGAELLVIEQFSPELKPLQEGGKEGSKLGIEALLVQGAVLDPVTWLAVIRFAGNLAEKKRQAIAELAAKKKEVELKRQELAAKLEELRRTTVPAQMAADIALRSDKAQPARITVRYTVDHVAWYPVYELHADDTGRKISVERQALVGQNSGEDWAGVNLTFTTLPPDKAVSVPEVNAWRIAYGDIHDSVESRDFGAQRPEEEAIARIGAIPGPEALLALREAYLCWHTLDAAKAFDYEDRLAQQSLELGQPGMGGGWGGGSGTFGQRSGGGRRLMVKRHGGSMGTENSVDSGASFLATSQRSDGSWNDTNNERYTVGITSAVLLSFLGAGHTSKVGEYKQNVRNGLAWLTSRVHPDGRVGVSLFDQAEAAMALAEAYGMSNDAQLAEPALRAIGHLDRMLQNRLLPLTPGLNDTGFPNGIENLAFAAGAAKSCKVAGLPVPSSLFESLIILCQQLERRKMTPRNSAVLALVRQFLGWKKEELEAFVPAILSELPSWTPGRFHLGFFQVGTLVVFQQGGDTWRQWNDAMKRALVEKLTPEGSWPAEDAWIGPIHSRVATSAFCASCLEVYYRYLMIDGGSGTKTGPSSPQAKLEWVPVSPQISANGRQYRFRADGLRSIIGDGKYHRIPIDRKTVDAQPLHVATPVIYKGVYLQSTFVNPFDEPLLEGAARVFLGNEFMGETPLPQAEPGKELVAPLGEDPYVAVNRTVSEDTAQAGKLTKLYTLQARIRISLENKRQIPIRARIFDRLAVSSDPRVRVRNGALKGGSESKQRDDGVATWDLALKAGETSALEAAYEVEYPDGVAPRPAQAP